jgi:Trm5-related predicted tRNA methylase
MSPTELTLKHLRAEGWTVAVVEKWNPHARIRQDLYGFIDILALRGSETLAVQATSYTNMSSRIKKIAEIETVAAVREAGWTIWVIGWRKVNNRWTHKITDVS